ncbi:MAG TPA: phosphoribosylaminoimidazolesuccinocarboxamide synthase [Elusimicrobia bacterium]|nr:MAG: phosphoribosylaminoimidazolesuccinocarboxamide synthase [Elusimicrobia bacterium GWA2_66_18]HAZ08815.1 phosphoribosylaminoimidazolesuccinocarboxamide synthase [Elusimicrobiota bacterium]
MGVTTTVPASIDIPGLKLLRRGKVRDVYDLGENLLMVASDRLSAFDVVLPTPIPDKGRILTKAALFWFSLTRDLVENHLVASEFDPIQAALPKGVRLDRAWFDGRMMLVKKAERVDAECVARAYLAGSGWKQYRETGVVGGHRLPPGLREADKLPQPIFTPATKADEGHDENITRERLAELVGADLAKDLERLTLKIFDRASSLLEKRGLLLADTKFEFGFINDRLCLIDELLTPDSSRIWEASAWKPGETPDGFDKQYVRDWLERAGWNKRPPAPALPAEVVEGALSRYRNFLKKVTS